MFTVSPAIQNPEELEGLDGGSSQGISQNTTWSV